MRAYRPEVPDAFESVVMHCLEKDRNRRFGSIAELAHALVPFAPQRAFASVERISGVMTGRYPAPVSSAFAQPALSTSAPEQPTAYIGGSAVAPAHTAGGATQASWGQTNSTKKRGPWLAIGLTGGVIALAAAGVAVKLLGSATAPSAAAANTVAPSAVAPSALAPSVVAPNAPAATTAAPIQAAPSAAASATVSAATPSAEIASVAASAVPAPSGPTPTHSKPAAQRPSAASQKKPGVAAKPGAASDPWGDGQH
jgi:hypothetical protein